MSSMGDMGEGCSSGGEGQWGSRVRLGEGNEMGGKRGRRKVSLKSMTRDYCKSGPISHKNTAAPIDRQHKLLLVCRKKSGYGPSDRTSGHTHVEWLVRG